MGERDRLGVGPKLDPYTVFADRPEVVERLRQAEELLGRVVRKEIPFSEVRTFLDQTGARVALTVPHPLLGGQSPMAALRARVEASVNTATQPASVVVKPDLPIRRRYAYRSQAPLPNQIKEEGVFPLRPHLEGFAAIANKDHIGEEGYQDVRIVHLIKQDVITMDTIRQLLQTYPNLRVIEVTKSHARLIGPGMQRLLDEHGIALEFRRMRHADHYDQVIPKDYAVKRELFESLQQDPDRTAQFKRMLGYELEEAEIAAMYFGETFMSAATIAEKLGFRHAYVQDRLEVFLTWLGVPYKNKGIQSMVHHFVARFSRLDQIGYSLEERQRFRRSFAVGDRLPPDTLPPSRWERWQRVHELMKVEPERFEALRKWNARAHSILLDFLQVGVYEREDIVVSNRQIGLKYGISREWVRILCNQACDFLGLLEQKESVDQ